jgi:hypothetical protein
MSKCSLLTLVLSFVYKYYPPMPHQAHNPNNYRRAILSAPPQDIAPNPHTNLLNVYIEVANKMGFKKIFRIGHDRFFQDS